MCCGNVLGQKKRLYIILQKLKNLPDDLKEFSDRGQAFFASSQSGWQTRDTFLWFVIIFINWLTVYRLHLKKEIRDGLAILIVDGHKSRECPNELQ
ncbi:hypothetical protein M9Y10_012703 [Tritrichomonas musculus]|uniref:DDE-1 domain-containing protein n=1 Tax=Tritrichomonas musculus TaxID=1915356 RepID=A0ABR2IDT0_9EUKA